MKNFTFLLALLLLLQSCNVYHPERLTAAEAVAANDRVKVVTPDQKFRFKRLEQKDQKLIGITNRGSVTSKKVIGLPIETNADLLKVDISQLNIEEIRRRNNTASTLLSIVVPVVAVLGGIIALASASMANSSWGNFDLEF